MKKIVLAASGISKAFGETHALSKASVAIRDGEILGLVGPNGAGKSTLTRICVGLEKQDSGGISYFGKNPGKGFRELKASIAMVPQEPSFYRSFTVRQNLEFFSSLYGMKRENAKVNSAALMKWLHLSRFADKRAEFLSGGYKRLLNIACSLVNNPKIVFLDEPTVGLDPKMRQLMWEKIKQLQKTGKTIILTTHYMDEAEELCDRVALMSEGKISVLDSPKRLISRYGGKTVVLFRLNKNVEGPLLKAAEKGMPGTIVRGMQSGIALTVKQANVTKAIVRMSAIIKETGYEIRESIVKEPELEDVFLNLTGKAIKEQ